MNKLFIMWVFMAMTLSPAAVSASALTVGGKWETFFFENGLAPINTPAEGFQITSDAPFSIKITDAWAAGDCFDVKVNNALLFSSPLVANTGLAITNNPDDAYRNPVYSKGMFVLNPGTYQIDITLTQLAKGYPHGAGFIKAGPVVPVPVPFWLLGTGLLGLAGLGKRLRS
jgi:hypothetical protein